MTIEALRERLAYWQRVLRLQDWDIALRMVTDVRDFADADYCGECRAQTDYRRAVILLLDPAVEATREVRTGLVAEFCYEPEQVLVHELLHLIVPKAEGCEYAVESLAKTLMGLKQQLHEPIRVSVDGRKVANAVAREVRESLAADDAARKRPRHYCAQCLQTLDLSTAPPRCPHCSALLVRALEATT